MHQAHLGKRNIMRYNKNREKQINARPLQINAESALYKKDKIWAFLKSAKSWYIQKTANFKVTSQL
jgi:hypothetical protein